MLDDLRMCLKKYITIVPGIYGDSLKKWFYLARMHEGLQQII